MEPTRQRPVPEIQKRWVTTTAHSAGASGQGKTKLVNYDVVKLVHTGGLKTALVHGTIFTMDSQAFTSCFSYFIATAAIILAVNYQFPDYVVGDTTTIDNFASNLNGIVPFVLGFYLSRRAAGQADRSC